MKNKFDRGLKVAIITGIDKPKTFVKDNHIYVYFADNGVNITTINDFNTEYNNISTELFYWSAETAPMICKQVHVIKRWLEANPKFQFYWKNATYENIRRFHETLLRNVIYTTWDESWFQANKSIGWWHTEFDTWFRNNHEFADKYLMWKQGIDWLGQTLGDFVVKRNNEPDGFVKFIKTYKVALMNPVTSLWKK
jgi:hypothetical protein